MKIKDSLRLAVLVMLCLFLNGCNERMSSDQIRRARLVGSENLVLKKQLRDKDSLIDDKNALINSKDIQIAELTKQLEQSKQETAMAQDRTTKMEKNFSDAAASYQQQLEECQKTVDAKPVPCPEVEEKYNVLYTDILNKWTECETKLQKYEQTAADANQAEK